MNVAGLVARMEGIPEQLRGAGPLMCLSEHRSLSFRERVGEPALSHVITPRSVTHVTTSRSQQH